MRRLIPLCLPALAFAQDGQLSFHKFGQRKMIPGLAKLTSGYTGVIHHTPCDVLRNAQNTKA